jgi:hypothetical protein
MNLYNTGGEGNAYKATDKLLFQDRDWHSKQPS